MGISHVRCACHPPLSIPGFRSSHSHMLAQPSMSTDSCPATDSAGPPPCVSRVQYSQLAPKDGSGRQRGCCGGRGGAARPIRPMCYSRLHAACSGCQPQSAEPGGLQPWFGAGQPRAGGQFKRRRNGRAMAGVERPRQQLARLEGALRFAALL